MLKYRLIFGTLMTIFFVGVVIFGGWLDGSITTGTNDDKPVKATILCILIALLAIPAQMEFAKLAKAKNLKIFLPVSIIASILFATAWYQLQIVKIDPLKYTFFLAAFVFGAVFLYQHIFFGTTQAIANCGVNYLSIVYIGVFSAFVLAIGVDFGTWPVLMFVLTVKASDIGAYTIGSLFGKHKFSPEISPKKTWEGLAGAIGFAIIVSFIFAKSFVIINWYMTVIFGFLMAFIGQLGDLAESMMKRDAQQKDSSSHVPGFGGLLDIIDSPLAAAPFAYLLFLFSLR